MKADASAEAGQRLISPMCQVSVGRHETCTWVECTCWCHTIKNKGKEAPPRADEKAVRRQRKSR